MAGSLGSKSAKLIFVLSKLNPVTPIFTPADNEVATLKG